MRYGTLTLSMLFQSTLPLRGATFANTNTPKHKKISIHTPLAGSDHHFHARVYLARYISIHTPLAGSD